ncbi:MAG: kelch repeat-containing protein [Candidatus Thorarchaeota archaeon]
MIKGEFLWAIGGKVENKYTVGDTTVYNINTNEWYSSENGQLSSMPYPVQGAGWTFFDKKIFCFGGKTEPHSGCCDYIQVYKIEEDAWELYNSMPKPRSKLGKYYPVIDNRYIYLFGGDNIQGSFNRVNWNWQYDLLNDTWECNIADALFSQSFPLPTYHNGWIYYSTGNTGNEPLQNNYKGSLNQRYNPKLDKWELMKPCPIPTTDGSGDKWQNEFHIVGGWNINVAFYNPKSANYKGPVRRQHLIYNYDSDIWRYESELPGAWHHGGTRASKNFLWRFLGTIDEDINIRSSNPHSNKIFRWDGNVWTEKAEAPVQKMNFGTIYTTIGPNF